MEADDPILFPPKHELLKQATSWEYGSLHSHEDILSILGYKDPARGYYSDVMWVNESLLSHGKYLEVIIGKGYRVINPNEFTGASNDKIRKSKRYLERAMIISQNAPRDKMSQDARKKSEEHAVGTARLYSLMSSESRPLLDLEKEHPKRRLQNTTPKVLMNGSE